MTRLYLAQREYDALLDAQGGRCCVKGCNAKDVKAIAKVKRLNGQTMSQYERHKKLG